MTARSFGFLPRQAMFNYFTELLKLLILDFRDNDFIVPYLCFFTMFTGQFLIQVGQHLAVYTATASVMTLEVLVIFIYFDERITFQKNY